MTVSTMIKTLRFEQENVTIDLLLKKKSLSQIAKLKIRRAKINKKPVIQAVEEKLVA